jgi:tetratricopeptide (TPR) repeat protein
MKVVRRRDLFHPRRFSNLYRSIGLLSLLIIGIWYVLRLENGTIQGPFEPTPTSTRSANSYVEEAQAYFDAGILDKPGSNQSAIGAYAQAAEVDPGNAEIWADLARVQTYSSENLTSDSAQNARLLQALASANKAVALAPSDSNVHAIRAFALDWYATNPVTSQPQSYLAQAYQEGTQAISLDAQNPLALAFYAEVLVDQQKVAQAEQYIQQALQIGPDLMDVHRVDAYVLESTANYSQAIGEYQKALQFSPNLTFLYISIGQNYRQLAFDSDNATEQNNLYNLALENFSTAANLDKQLQIQDPLPFVAIAKTYAQEGDFFAAALNDQQAVAYDPTNADLYGQLGNIYYRARNYETAMIALQCAVSGCTAVESCQARNGCPAGESGVAVTGLTLTPGSAVYYLDYGLDLAIFSPTYPNYCIEADKVLTQLMKAYGSDPSISNNAPYGLSICSSITSPKTQTAVPPAPASPSPTVGTPAP